MNYVEIIGKKGYNSLVTKSGNTYQEFHFKLIDSSMNPVVLTGKVVDVIIANNTGMVFRKVATILAEVGTMSMKFEDGEHLDYGNYDLEIHVKHQNGGTDIFPEGSYLQMKVMESLLDRLDNSVNRDILFDIIHRAEDAISRVGQSIQNATDAANGANLAKLGAIDATNLAIEATQQMGAVKEDAIIATDEANNARDNADTAARGADEAKDRAIEVTDRANLKVIEMEDLIEETIIAKDNTVQATEDAIEAISSVGQVIDESHNATIEAVKAKEEADLARDEAVLAAQYADSATDKANLSAINADLATNKAIDATSKATMSADKADSATDDARAVIAETILVKDSTLIAKIKTEEATNRANAVIELGVSSTEATIGATNDARVATENANLATLGVEDAIDRADSATDNSIDKAHLANEAAESANAVKNEVLEVLPNIQGLENKKIYSNSIQYVKNNIVHFNGSSYQAIQNTLGNVPNPNDSTYWSILAQRGIDGTGSVVSINNIHPDLEGNVDLGNIASDWSDITGKPTEFNPAPHTHAELHTHNNKNVIDGLSDDSGQLQYNGQDVGSVTSVNGQTGDIDGLATINELDVKVAEIATSSKLYTDTKIADVVGSSPETLDTLNELADALGRDPNFATTVATQIGGKVDKVVGKGLSTEDFTSSEKSQLGTIIDDWNLVETIQGAQTKADISEQNAKSYTDLQIDELGDGIIQQDTEPEGIEEGRLWIDTSDDTFQGTVFEEFNTVKQNLNTLISDNNTHTSNNDIHLDSEDRIKLDGIENLEETVERIRVAEENSKEYTDERMNRKITKNELDDSLIQEIDKHQELQEMNDKIEVLSSEILNSKESTSLTLNRGSQIVSTDNDSTVQLVSFEGKTIVNHAPLFDSGLWILNAIYSIASPSKVTGTVTGLGSTLIVDVSVKANTDYSLSLLHNNNVESKISDAANADIAPYTTSKSMSFNSGNNTLIKVTIRSVAAGLVVIENVMLNEGLTTKEFVANVKGVKNPTLTVKGKNLLDMSPWEAISTRTEDGFLLIKDGSPTLNIPVEKGKQYQFSLIGYAPEGTEGEVDIDGHDANGARVVNFGVLSYLFEGHPQIVETHVGNASGLFTPEDASYISVTFWGDVYIKDFIIHEGPVVQPFEPYREKSTTLLDTFHEGDTLYVDGNGQARVTKNRKEVVLNGSLAWMFHQSGTGLYAGVKVVKFPLPSVTKPTVIKYNGKVIITKSGMPVADTFDLTATDFYLSISNIDSGWGDVYTPTSDEIKAYFMGWRMLSWSTGLLYEGTGTKGWAKIKGNGGASDSQLNLPTSPHNTYEWQPYRLVYNLATPIDEPVHTIGSVSLQKGGNQIGVSEGTIVREVVNPKFNFSDSKYYFNALTSTGLSRLVYKARQITGVFRNGKLDASWTILTRTPTDVGQEYGLGYASTANFDPTAVYEADYTPFEQYRTSAHANPIVVEYQETIGMVVSQLVEDVTSLTSRMNSNEKEINESPTYALTDGAYAKRPTSNDLNLLMESGLYAIRSDTAINGPIAGSSTSDWIVEVVASKHQDGTVQVTQIVTGQGANIWQRTYNTFSGIFRQWGQVNTTLNHTLTSTSNSEVATANVIKQLNDLKADKLQEGGITVGLQNGWTSISTLQIYRDTLGIVHIAGWIQGGTLAANTVVFTLPVGYRPTSTAAHGIPTNSTATDGRVVAAYFNNGQFTLDGTALRNLYINISFR